MENVYQNLPTCWKYWEEQYLLIHGKCLQEMHGGLWTAGRSCICRPHLLQGEGLSLEQNNCL